MARCDPHDEHLPPAVRTTLEIALSAIDVPC
jgi:hypothetical protein